MKKQLLVLPEGKRFSETQRKELSDNGFIMIYMKDPAAARLLSPEIPLSGDSVLLAALQAVRKADCYASYRIFMDGLITEVQNNAQGKSDE